MPPAWSRRICTAAGHHRLVVLLLALWIFVPSPVAAQEEAGRLPAFFVDPLPEVTGNNHLTLGGTRRPGTFIDLVVTPGARVSATRYPAGNLWEIDVNGLKDGHYRLLVSARDSYGVVGRQQYELQVDRTAPKVHIVTPSGGIVRQSEPLLRVEREEGEMSVLLDGRLLPKDIRTLGPLADGPHELTVVVTDRAGNRGQDRIRFVVDTRPPKVRILAPADGDRTSSQPLVDYRIEDGEGRLLLDGEPVEVAAGERLPRLKDGRHELRLEATDEAGNMAVSQVVFTVDSRAPRVILLAPAAGLTYDDTPLLQFRVDRGEVRVLVDGEVVDKHSGMSLDPLAPGEHVVRVEAVDEAGNLGYAERRLIVADVAPLPTRTDDGPRFEQFSARLDRSLVDAGSTRPLVLTIGPLSFAGETVHIEQWADSNGNGVADAGEQVIRTFRLVDGLASPSPLVPGDSDGVADRRIRAEFLPQILHDRMDGVSRYVLLIMAEHDLAEVAFRVTAD